MGSYWIDLLAIGAMYVGILYIGVAAAKKTRDASDSEGMLLARRQMPLGLTVFTMIATWVGGGYINGTAESVYGQGLVWTQAPWGYALSLMLGGLFFAVPLRRLKCVTMLDPFEWRYGKRMAAGLFLPALVGEIFWSAAVLAALGTTFGTILDFDFSTAVIISSVFAIGYTVVGGLWSVAYTDRAQLLMILIGLAIAIPFALRDGGGLENVLHGYEQHFKSDASFIPPAEAWRGEGEWKHKIWLWLDMAGLLVLGGVAWQSYFQRVLAVQSHRTAIGMSVLAGIGCAAIAVPAGLIGAIGVTADWSAAGVTAPEPASLVLPYVFKYLTPPAIATVGLAMIAAAVMSSVDSSILSAASMLVWNVYRPLLRPKAPEKEIRLVIRCGIVLVGAAATLLAITAQSVYQLWYLCSDLVYVILFPQLVMVLFFKRANWIGAAAGASLSLFLRLGGGEPYLYVPAYLPYPMRGDDGVIYFPFRTTAMLAGLVAIGVVSLLTGKWARPRSLVNPAVAATSA